MDFTNLTIGYGITGSFCTHAKSREQIQRLLELGATVIPIFSYETQQGTTRFGNCAEYVQSICDMTGSKGIRSIVEAEPIGPTACQDMMIIAPCTGNTAAKLWNGITDTPVLMAAKAHMRNQKPLVIAIATNDALGMNFKSIGNLMCVKGIYFVPFGQDSYIGKPNSLVADFEQIADTMEWARSGKQIQPLLLSPK